MAKRRKKYNRKTHKGKDFTKKLVKAKKNQCFNLS